MVLKVREVATPHPGELAALPCLPDLTANVNSADSVLFVQALQNFALAAPRPRDCQKFPILRSHEFFLLCASA